MVVKELDSLSVGYKAQMQIYSSLKEGAIKREITRFQKLDVEGAINAYSAPTQSLAIGTPRISTSPLLAEFTSPDGAHDNALAPPSGKSTGHPQAMDPEMLLVKIWLQARNFITQDGTNGTGRIRCSAKATNLSSLCQNCTQAANTISAAERHGD
ncbi:hypothetical protein KIW84_035208 [Lathyrus oleraceus]|uniref:Uncharacterized protein n=1 Tax=Pisum sativum TaxID=3888 RepID=A0A9D5B256_PEA|nr:hypothetical protein KIW84_035208 [Pisum sativum]